MILVTLLTNRISILSGLWCVRLSQKCVCATPPIYQGVIRKMCILSYQMNNPILLRKIDQTVLTVVIVILI
jgi:hypothetical protein